MSGQSDVKSQRDNGTAKTRLGSPDSRTSSAYCGWRRGSRRVIHAGRPLGRDSVESAGFRNTLELYHLV